VDYAVSGKSRHISETVRDRRMVTIVDYSIRLRPRACKSRHFTDSYIKQVAISTTVNIGRPIKTFANREIKLK